MKHPTPYKVYWLQKGYQLLVNEQCNVEFQIGTYKDVVLCDIIPMDVCHIFLGRPWQYEKKNLYYGRKNTYYLEKDGKIHTWSPLEDEAVPECSGSTILLMIGKELLPAYVDVFVTSECIHLYILYCIVFTSMFLSGESLI